MKTNLKESETKPNDGEINLAVEQVSVAPFKYKIMASYFNYLFILYLYN